MMALSRFIVFIILLIPASWTEIGRKNAAKKNAAESYSQANYEASVAKHQLLKTEFGVNSPELNYNLALSYHYNGHLEEAQQLYLSLTNAPDKIIASFASNQNGTILGKQKKYDEALQAFKLALIKDPLNESARYNYELLSRWLEQNPEEKEKQQEQEQEDQEKQEEQQDQESQDKKEQQEKKDGEGEEETKEDEASESQKKEDKSGEKSQQEEPSEEPSDMESDLSEREKAMQQMKERLEKMNLNPEQAAQILDAMNAAELRYIQQNKKKPTKRPDRGLPDW